MPLARNVFKLDWEVIAEQAFTMGVNRRGPDYSMHEEPQFIEVDERALYGDTLPLEKKDIPAEIAEEDLPFYYLGGNDEPRED